MEGQKAGFPIVETGKRENTISWVEGFSELDNRT